MNDDLNEDWDDEEPDDFCDVSLHYVWYGDMSFYPQLDEPKEMVGICRWCRAQKARVLVDWALTKGMTHQGVLNRIESLYIEEGEHELGQLLGQALLERFLALTG